jgi:hypothetical protein
MSFFQEYLDELVFEKIAEDTGDRIARGALGAGALAGAGGLGYGALQAHRYHGVLDSTRRLQKGIAGGMSAKRQQYHANRISENLANMAGGKYKKGKVKHGVPNLGKFKSPKKGLFNAMRQGSGLGMATGIASKGNGKMYSMKDQLRRASRTRLGLGLAAAGSAGLGGYNVYKAIRD